MTDALFPVLAGFGLAVLFILLECVLPSSPPEPPRDDR